ncbi:MAG TPA: hypothetical protein VGI64_16405 [Streptosporangiaceae bacterium]|jgi:hypothetical protein
MACAGAAAIGALSAAAAPPAGHAPGASGRIRALRGQQGALTCHAVTRSILLAVDRTSLRDLLQSGPPA